MSLFLSVTILISTGAAWASEGRVNKSAPGLIWSTGKEEGDLYRKPQSEEHEALNENDELDGGFSSLDGMLQWAIGITLFALSIFHLQHNRLIISYPLYWETLKCILYLKMDCESKST